MGKRVFITGTSAGFGRGAAKALASKGHTVFATMRGVTGKNEENAVELQNWAEREKVDLHVLELDVTDQASIDVAVKEAIGKGGIDVLVNNAGVGTWGIDEGFTVEQAKAIFDINVFGVMRLNRAVLPHFREKKHGQILYVSSGLGRIVIPFLGIYTASKFALEAYAENASYELAPLGIRSTIIQPGAYGTTFLQNSLHPKNDVTGVYGPTAKMFEAFGAGFEERAKAGGLGDPREIIDALVEEVEASGDRALRRCVGADVQQGVGAINATAAQVQGHLLESFGMK